MRRNKLAIALALYLFPTPWAVAEPAPVYQLESSAATYLEVDLDREIYRYSQDAILRDVMVLDAEGKELPSRIVTLHAETTERSQGYPLNFFPVRVGEDPSTWLSRRGAELRIDEEVVSLRLDPERRHTDATVEYYIVDISKLDQPLDRLEIHWQVDEATRVLAAEVSASRDLQHWTPVARDTLVQLSKDSESLLRNTIDLSLREGRYQYLRLRFLTSAAINLQHLNGLEVVRQAEGPPPQRWQISGALADDQRPVRPERSGAASKRRNTAVAWEFQRDDRAPANRLSIALGSEPYGDRVRLYSRENPREAWQLRYAGIWFNVKVGDQWQQSDSIALSPNRDPFWRLEMSNSDEAANPELVFEYPQQRLQFIANNNPPYTIATNDEVPTQRSAEQVLARVLDGREVSWQSVGKQLMEGAQAVERRVGWNWQAVLFWLALSVAVIVLAVFALRLLRQLDAENQA